MKSSAKRLLALAVVLAMALTLLPGLALAVEEPVLVAEGSAAFATNTEAFNGESVLYTPETNGEITVEILACDPGYYLDIYEGPDWLEEYFGSGTGCVTFSVTAGKEYEILLCSCNVENPGLEYPQAGSISYQVTFLSNGQVPGGGEEPEDPSLTPGGTPENPKSAAGSFWEYIGAGKTVWYLFDNYQNMVDNGIYSMMLHITSGADYAVTYAGAAVPVDENGFVNFEMMDGDKLGTYLFSVTNNSAEEKFFSFEIKERPVYYNTGESLKIGRNNLTLDTTYPYTLYEFSPTQTGIYQIRVTQGMVGDWGTPFNPVDNTPNKTNTLIWTCTSVGQTLMVGFKGPKTTACTIIRTGEYVPPVEDPWNFYENTYDFSYVPDANAEIQDVDLTDGGQHTAVLGEDGFYHYGTADGPLMVTDLSTVEINLADAQLNGGLRAWLVDEDGKTVSKNDYNNALKEYLDAGLVPVTAELAMMLQELGIANGWWVEGGMIFAETVPADLSMAWMQLCGYLLEPQGVTVAGAVTTGADGDTTLELIAGGEVIASVTVSGKTGTYSFEAVAAGTYTLKVSKQNHVTREYTVTVADADLTQDVKIHLLGDIDGNGTVNMNDVTSLYAHVKGTKKITDEYKLLVANVNGGSINMNDVTAVYAHVKGTRKLY